MAARFILTHGMTDARYLPTQEFDRKMEEALAGLYNGKCESVEPFLDLEGRGFIVDGLTTFREVRKRPE